MNILHIIKAIVLCIYLFGSSIFMHTQAMGMGADGILSGDCGMHHSIDTEQLPIDSNCYETCVGAYDDLSYYTYTQDTLKYTFCDIHYSKTNYNIDTAIHKHRHTHYLDEVGRGGGLSLFTDIYIYITKKSE